MHNEQGQPVEVPTPHTEIAMRANRIITIASGHNGPRGKQEALADLVPLAKRMSGSIIELVKERDALRVRVAELEAKV